MGFAASRVPTTRLETEPRMPEFMTFKQKSYFSSRSYWTYWKWAFLILSWILVAPAAHAFGDNAPESTVSSNPLSAEAKLIPSKIPVGGTSELIIEMTLDKSYHAYLDRFKLAIESPDDIKLADFKITPVVEFMDTFSNGIKKGIKDSATMLALIEVPTGFETGSYVAKVKLTYQACTKEHCLFPKSIYIDVPFEATAASATDRLGAPPMIESSTTSTSSAAKNTPTLDKSEFEKALNKGIVPALIFVFLVGFATSLTPCIYPMIPITLAVVGARSKGQSKLKSFSLSITYVLGIALTYALLGLVAARTGALFGSALSNIYVVTAIAIVFVAMGLSMYGLYEIQPPAFIRNQIGAAKTNAGYSGAFMSGLVAGVVASPCVGPVLVSVLAYIAQSQSMALGFVFLFTFAIGMGVLFIILGTSSSLLGHLPKAGPWMESVKFIFGSVMVAMALYYVQPIYPSWLFHLLLGGSLVLIASAYGAFEPNSGLQVAGRIRKGVMLASFIIGLVFTLSGVAEKADLRLLGANVSGLVGSPGSESFPKLNWQPYSDQLLEAARTSQKPILIDFYADWCVACKELEKYTFTDERIRALSEKFVLLKVDATTDFPGLDELKSKYKVMGLPTMIFYDGAGKLRFDLTVTGFEDADTFLRRMQSATSETQQVSQSASSESL